MLPFLFVCRFGLSVANSVATTSIHQNQTELANLSIKKSSVIGTDSDIASAPVFLGNPIDDNIRTIIKVHPDVLCPLGDNILNFETCLGRLYSRNMFHSSESPLN